MERYMHAVRSSLKLAELTLQERLKALEKQPVGLILRRNQSAHTIFLIALLKEIREVADHDESTWWENDEQVPF